MAIKLLQFVNVVVYWHKEGEFTVKITPAYHLTARASKISEANSIIREHAEYKIFRTEVILTAIHRGKFRPKPRRS